MKNKRLEDLTPFQLSQIVIKLDSETRELRQSLTSLQEEYQTQQCRLEKAEKDAVFFQHQRDEMQTALKVSGDEVEEVKTLLDCRNFEIRSLKEINDSLRSEARAKAELVTKLTTETTELSSENSILGKQKAALTDSHNQLQGRLQELKDNNSLLIQEKHEIEEKLQGAQHTAYAQAQKIKAMEEDDTADKMIRQLKNRVSLLESEVSIREKKLKALNDNIEAKVQEGLVQLQQSLTEHKLEIYKLKEAVVVHSTRECKLTETLTKTEEKLTKAKTRKQEFKHRVQELTEENIAVHGQLHKIEKDRTVLNKVRTLPQSVEENKVLYVMKVQAEYIYQLLNQLVMDSKTLKSTANEVFYQITVDRFSYFEKEFNKMLISLHEAVEHPASLTASNRWLQKVMKAMNVKPSKLFSCVPAREEPLTKSLIE